jgi:Ca2+-binding RTX toxin-like protein
MRQHGRLFLSFGAWFALSAGALAGLPRAVTPGDRLAGAVPDLQPTPQIEPDFPAIADCLDFFDFGFDFARSSDQLDNAGTRSGVSVQPQSATAASHILLIANGCLRITGTAAGSTLALRLRAGVPSILEIDIGNDGVADFSADRSRFNCIVVNARGGDDVIFIDESNGVFTDTEATTIDGGSGDDTLLGGSGGETFIGGPGNDLAFLGGGDDLFIWNPGDGTDSIEGGSGVDTVEINGGDADESFTITANGTRVRFDRIDPAPFNLDIGTCENLVLNAGGGNDSLACTGNLAALIHITADGGPGNDTLLGSNGADLLIGGDDNDFIDGNQGNDTILMGAGNDTFQWDPGDGNDTIEGQGGHDVVLFNGSNIGELFEFLANGARLRFIRNIGNIVLDADGIEQFDLRTLGGADVVTANDLTGTTLKQVNIDLSANGGVPDAQTDSVNIAGTSGPDTFNVSADAGFTVVDGAADIRVKGYEPGDQVVFNGVGGDVVNVNGSEGPDTMTVTANGTQARVDANGFSAGVAVSGALSLVVKGLGGPDTISCTGNLAGLAIPITLDGGPGDDILLGSNGADLLLGGDDDDFIDGKQGNDTALLGAGNDTFQWDPGDGNDTIEGQAGHDIVLFNGSAIAEIFDLSANGQRLRFTRNIANIVMDADGIEQFDLRALGGADFVTVNDLTGTDIAEVSVQLAGTFGGNTGDSTADNVIVNGTNGDDDIVVASGITSTLVMGLSAVVSVFTADAALDRLTVNALGGNDHVQATGLAIGVIGLTLSGGIGDDVLIGSNGSDVLNGDDDNDTITGGAGDDTIQLGAGNDRSIWNPGDGSDLVEGGDGVDTVEVNGSDGDEAFTVTANGTRVRFDRINPAPFFLDIGTSENLVLNANGGNDSLACTGNLAALIQITADGGPGEDTLRGGNGADVLIGGDDNDFIDGNQGNDTILLGAGDDTFQWDPGDGNDTIEGQDGHDVVLFNGSNIAEIFELSAIGSRLRFTRNIGNNILDADGIEQFDLHAVGGADALTINSLAGTALAQVNVDLAGTIGDVNGDSQADTITVNGTNAPDTINIAANAGAVEVSGLSAFVRITTPEVTLDRLTVNGLGGVDTITSGPGVPALIIVSINQ